MSRATAKNVSINMPTRGILKKRTVGESLSNSPPVRRSGPKRSCSFDLVEIREHQIIMDKPISSEGLLAPLTISWHAVSTDITTVQEFELTRISRQARSLDTAERISLLICAGYKLEQICLGYSKPSCPTNKSKSKSSKSKGSKSDQKSEKATKTVLSRMKIAAKKMVKHNVNDLARKSLYNAAA